MRKLAWFAGGFGVACLLCCYELSGLWMALAGGVLFLLAAILWRRNKPKAPGWADKARFTTPRRMVFGISRRLMALCLGGLLGFGWFAGYSALFYAPTAPLAGTEQTISGTVASYPRETSIGGYSVTLKMDGGLRAPDVLCYGSEDWADLKPGDRLTCHARLKFSGRMFGDDTTYYTAKGVFLIGYCNDEFSVESAEWVPPGYWPALCARKLNEGIYAAFDEKVAPLAAAVTIGDKTGLDEQLYSALNRSGVMHAAVVSGMHISFLVSVLMILCRGDRRVALALVPLLVFYALMAGGTPSAFRAVIMQAALLAGPVLGREPDPPSSMGLALLVLLVQNPFAAASVSLQLSFASVAGILLVTNRIHEAVMTPVKRRIKNRPLRTVCRVVTAQIATTVGAMLFSVPLIVLYFEQILIFSPLTNVLVLWAVTLFMVAALVIGTLAVFLPAVMVWPGYLFGLLGHYIRAAVLTIGSRPLASLPAYFPVFALWLAAAYLQIPGWVFAKRCWRQVGLSALCLVVLLGAAIGLNARAVKHTDLTVTALDVGQGASTLFLAGDAAVLVDCGGNDSTSAGDRAADHLTAIGRDTLDLLVLTHLDSDHCNGVAQLLYRVNVRRIAVPYVEEDWAQLEILRELAAAEGAELTFVTERQTLPIGTGALTLYPPLGKGTSNEEGLFVLCSHGEFDVLVTGDADSFVERMLVKYYDLPDIEVLLVGHHGARNSTCEELLNTLRPETAVISVGYNSYGHPAGETLDRLAASGAKIFRTDENGTVTIAWKDGMIAIT